VTGKLFVLSFE